MSRPKTQYQHEAKRPGLAKLARDIKASRLVKSCKAKKNTMLTANEIRKSFLDFFQSKNHSVIASDSLVPKDDPTVLFTTAGMQQFKQQFLGHIDGFTCATTSQKCLRTDDLDQVGVTAFHHTMFEMLGNFSFGDYFKKEAILWAWEFLTTVLKIAPEKLWVSVYHEDAEAESIWIEQVKIPKNRLVKLGDKSNFWPANAKVNGPNGPCGPCSEIFFDYGVNLKCVKKEKCDPDCNCGRFSEIWNLVFTQFNRKDGGVLEPLPNKNIDTGMGLERLVAVIQGKQTNYDTDLFMPIRLAIRKNIDSSTIQLLERDELVIADHIRAIVFAISDGVIPSNKERGSVVKRLINDSTNLVLSAGGTEPSIYKLVPTVIEVFKSQYPEIQLKQQDLMSLILKTEEAFLIVRKERLPEFQVQVQKATSAADRGEIYFRFHDTYGLPLSTIVTTALSLGISSDDNQKALTIYHTLMKEQQDRARASSKMMGDVFVDNELHLDVAKTDFIGYTHLSGKAKLLKLFINNQEVLEASQGDTVKIVLDKTPFYAQAGGQIGDSGFLLTGIAKIQIEDTQKLNDIYLHSGKIVQGIVRIGDPIHAEVDDQRRLSIMRNHTATHILQSALRKILGTHVQQQGSLVAEDRLRFDFTHPQALTAQQKIEIENFVNASIKAHDHVDKKEMSLEDAKKLGALSFFAEKYGAKVRVISIGDFSKEFCGGTHLDSTAQIEKFKLSSEGAVAQGIRRIEAKTANFATLFEDEQQQLAAEQQRRNQEKLKQKEQAKILEKEQFEAFVKDELDGLLKSAQDKNDAKLIIQKFSNTTIEFLRKVSDFLKSHAQCQRSVLVLANDSPDQINIVVAVSSNLTNHINANDIIKAIVPLINGNGGGRPDLAQAGSKENKNLDRALEKARDIILAKLENKRP
jgi:alanyl-tRNA synthetase